MAHDCSSLESLEFGDSYRPQILSYSDLDDDCHYLTLREDPVQFQKKSADKNINKMSKRSIFKSLKELEKVKLKISGEIRALKKKSKPIEVIDLVSEEKSTIDQDPPLKTSNIQSSKMKVSNIQTLPNSPLRKKYAKRHAESDYSEQESYTSDESCECCLKRKERKRRKIILKKCAIDSNDSCALKFEQKQKYRKKCKETATNTCNVISKANYATRRKDVSKFYDVEEVFDNFKCRVCNIEVRSRVSLKAHLVGNKHLRNLKAQSIPDVALQSLEQFSSKQFDCVPVEYDENELLHYPTPAPGKTRIRVKKIAKLQAVAESYREQPIIGLTYVTEIHLPREVIYYCELCDANCVPNSIMCHLIGFKHRLNFFKMKFPIMYERFQYKPKKCIENEIVKLIIDYDKTHGRGLIKVEEEVDDIQLRKKFPLRRRSRSYSPHRQNCKCNCKSYEVWISSNNDRRRNKAENLVTDDLDTSMNDFYCKICESHMNNQQMWEVHVRGKRHLKNKKKGPGEKPSKIRNIYCPGERAALMNDLRDIREPLVGLNFIQEVQGRGGNQYKCFLCGACCSSFDIIEHIISEKHRIKLLEVENKKGNKNGIDTILNLNLSERSRKTLIAEAAEKFERKYGKGKVLVYKSKDIFYRHN